jgi:hypothetical protein
MRCCRAAGRRANDYVTGAGRGRTQNGSSRAAVVDEDFFIIGRVVRRDTNFTAR